MTPSSIFNKKGWMRLVARTGDGVGLRVVGLVEGLQGARMVTTHRPPIVVLTGLRFFAALSVVLFHYQRFLRGFPIISEIIGHGNISVSFFFILSGFILTYTYADQLKSNTLREIPFMKRRVARIFPMHIFVLILGLPLFWSYDNTFLTQYSKIQIGLSWLSHAFLLQVYFPSDLFISMWNRPDWSIGNELLFYATFPFLTKYVIQKYTSLSQLRILWVMIALVQLLVFCTAVIGLWMHFGNSDQFNQCLNLLIDKSPFFRIWEFLIGCVTGLLFLEGQNIQPSSLRKWGVRDSMIARNFILMLLFSLIVIFMGISIPRGQSFGFTFLTNPRWAIISTLDILRMYPAFTAVFALVILVLASGTTFAHRLLTAKYIVLLGEASYSLYVTHWTLLYFLRRQPWIPVTCSLAIAFLISTVLLSIACYSFIELPVRRFLLRRIMAREN